jgi:hypothetical protein
MMRAARPSRRWEGLDAEKALRIESEDSVRAEAVTKDSYNPPPKRLKRAGRG